jgi:hypothetical protein
MCLGWWHAESEAEDWLNCATHLAIQLHIEGVDLSGMKQDSNWLTLINSMVLLVLNKFSELILKLKGILGGNLLRAMGALKDLWRAKSVCVKQK